MFVGVKIENFRNFSSLELSDLQSINLITGKNGCGKTAILEAIFLNAAASNTNTIMTINHFRGEQFTTYLNDRPFLSLFNRLSSKRNISISSQWLNVRGATTPANRDLVIRPIPAEWKFSTVPEGRLSGLEMEFKGQGQKTTARLRWQEEDLRQNWPNGTARPPQAIQPQYNYRLAAESPPNKAAINSMYVLASPRDALQQIYTHLVSATRDKNIPKIVNFVQMIDSRLANLVPLNEDGINTVWVDIGEDALVPLTMMGNGFIDILHIACSIIQSGSRVILIDEIESGLHYQLYPELAAGLIALCKETGIQLFITTHSGEVISAFAEQLKRVNFTDICALRVSRREKESVVTRFDAEDIENSNDIELDLR
jgi:AAA15 family ATPase/GTPase